MRAELYPAGSLGAGQGRGCDQGPRTFTRHGMLVKTDGTPSISWRPTTMAMFFFLTLFTQVVWGYSALRGGLAYLPFIGGFLVAAGICSRLISRVGARVPMTIGAFLAPAGMFWLSRIHENSSYLTGVCLPLLVFAAAAGLIFVPLTMTVVAGIPDEHSGITVIALLVTLAAIRVRRADLPEGLPAM